MFEKRGAMERCKNVDTGRFMANEWAFFSHKNNDAQKQRISHDYYAMVRLFSPGAWKQFGV